MSDPIKTLSARQAGASAWISWMVMLVGTTPGMLVKKAIQESDQREAKDIYNYFLMRDALGDI